MTDFNKFNLLEFRFNLGALFIVNKLNFALIGFNFGLILTAGLTVLLWLMH